MTDSQIVARKHDPRPLEDLNLLDDFLFQQMLAQEKDGEEFCRILLKTILGKAIRKVRIIPQKNILGIDTAHHGIRMDAYIEDISDENTLPEADMVDAQVIPDIYDIEPNNSYEKASLPKRIRYYHGLIDTQLLAAGTAYTNLPNIVTIVILPYDPFGLNRMIYTIQNQCVEDSTMPYNDGAKKIFLYTKGIEGNPSQELRDMLKYLEKTNDDNVTNQDIDTIHHLVKKVKHRREVGISYMKSWEIDQMHREEGRAEGRKEGRAEGIISAFQKMQLPREDALTELMQILSLTKDDAEAYMNLYWK